MDALRREFDAAWARFKTVDALRLVPDTLESEWPRGRDTYLAFLTPVDDPAVVGYLRGVARVIERIPGVEPYPEDYWHITVKGIGFEARTAAQPEDVSASQVAGVAVAARDVFAGQPAFETQIGLVSAFPQVVFAEVWGSAAVRDLNVRLIEAMPGIVRYPFDGGNFLPHISIARFTSNDGLAQLEDTIARLRDGPAGPAFTIRDVHLMRARLSERAPSFETIETYQLTTDH